MLTRLPALTLAGAFAALAASAVPGAANALEFERAALAAGSWWRLVTCHFVHFGARHLLWDVAVWVLLGLMCEQYSRARTALALGVAAIAIPAAIWWVQPEFIRYRGLSGLDSALFKCGAELLTSRAVFAASDSYQPVPLAHFVGALCGVLAVCCRVPATCPSSACSAVQPLCPSDRFSRTPVR
jgi:hypothetical protein